MTDQDTLTEVIHPDELVNRAAVERAAEGTEVALRSPRTLVVEDEWSTVDDGDLSPSQTFTIPLFQLNRKVDGGFLNEDTGETQRDLRAVLMAKVNTRAWWPEPFGKGDAAPACRSSDGIVPLPTAPAQQPEWEPPKNMSGEVPAKVCADCPNSQWDGGDPPPCAEAIEFLAFVPTTLGAGRVVRLRFSGLAFGPARSYWDSFRTRLPKRPPIAFVTHITLEERETDNGTFLVPTFTRDGALELDEAQPIIDVRSSSTTEWKSAIETDDRPLVTNVDAGETSHDEEPF